MITPFGSDDAGCCCSADNSYRSCQHNFTHDWRIVLRTRSVDGTKMAPSLVWPKDRKLGSWTAEVNHSDHYSGVPEVEILESWTYAEMHLVFIPTSNNTTIGVCTFRTLVCRHSAPYLRGGCTFRTAVSGPQLNTFTVFEGLFHPISTLWLIIYGFDGWFHPNTVLPCNPPCCQDKPISLNSRITNFYKIERMYNQDVCVKSALRDKRGRQLWFGVI